MAAPRGYFERGGLDRETLRAEVEALRAEVQRLRAELETLKDRVYDDE